MSSSNPVDTKMLNYMFYHKTIDFDTFVHPNKLLMEDIDILYFDKLNID